jgi:hypothetical protein
MTTSSRQKIILVKNQLKLTGDPDQDDLISSLADIEIREGHKRGWDQEPQVWAVHRPQPGQVMISVIPADTWQSGLGNPVDDLALLASQAPRVPLIRLERPLGSAPGNLAAIALMCETWSVFQNDLSDAEMLAQRTGKRLLHQHPKRIESRMVLASDINGVIYCVLRNRGEQPRYSIRNASGTYGDGGGRETVLTGRLPRVLERLAYGASVPDETGENDLVRGRG